MPRPEATARRGAGPGGECRRRGRLAGSTGGAGRPMAYGLVRIIVNPISGRGHDPEFIDGLVRHLTLRAFPVEVTPTQRRGHARDLAAETPDDARCVVSIGGDGTHREVLAGLAGRRVPACIVPSGTENVLGRTFRLTGTIRDTVGLVCMVDHETGVPQAMGVASQKEGEGDRCELNVAQRMIRNLPDLTNALITADPLHCQTRTAQDIVALGGDFLVQAKDNQKTVHQCAEGLTQDLSPLLPAHKKPMAV